MMHATKDLPHASEEDLAASIAEMVSEPDFPQYGYGMMQAVALGAALGHSAVSVLELGVAGGNGLVAMERLRGYLDASGVDVEISGFDLGTGMPEPSDYRDMPYIWRQGFFRMDEPKLRAQLRAARLYIGNIRETGRRYIADEHPPIGFISFDLDYYSSTVAAFSALLEGPAEKYLPRVICYFDDTVGPHHEMHSEFTGELLAIREFNEAHARRKLSRLNGLRYKLAPHDGPWVEGIFVLHLFDHPRYNDYVYPVKDRQFPLTEGVQ